MTDIALIGLGAMGSALGRTLLGGGHGLTVWNRTASKTEAMKLAGAVVAPSVVAAVASSPVVIVCVDNYEVTREILGGPDVRAALAGRLLVQLSTGTPKEARDLAAWAIDCGAEYLDGAILAYPDQMGTPDAAVLVSGPTAAYERCAPRLRPIAGGLTHVGEAVGAAAALDCASLSFLFGALLGTIHGARICEVEGLPVDEFGTLLSSFLPVLGGEIGQITQRIQGDRFDDTQAALQTYAAAAGRLMQQATDGGIPQDFPAFASTLFRKATDAGAGREDLAALVKVLRTGP